MATPTNRERVPVPRRRDGDYTAEAASERLAFLRARTGAALEHVSRYSFDPAVVEGNVEQFVGVAQVPIGIAGPLLVDGEHATGTFYVPLATAEGTLVASYNRGMRLLYEAGGVKTTVLDDRRQRAPAFIFPSARQTRAFCGWLEENFDRITQRECLEMLGCYGAGHVRKFAEIVAATVLCGELSLGSAIVSEEWVDAHDAHGRNRP
jgi:hydroxymethylglutaryl-CoA reductase